MTIAYFDCFSGISGDMSLGALVDAGVPLEVLRSELAQLNVSGYDISAERTMRSGISATKVHVAITRHGHHARNLNDILGLIERSVLSPSVKEKSSSIFRRLAEAESRIHATSSDRIHFHELGAIDAIVDIVGSVIGLELLGIDRIVCSAINVGSGTIQTSHGLFPIPAPATAELLKGISIYQSSTEFELATPTGAAIVSTLGSSFGHLPQMKLDRIAYGAGSKDFPGRPNVLRIILGEISGSYEEDTSVLIESNIDDMNPQLYEYLIDKLMQNGAHDAYLTPIIMKKGRPAILLSVLTDAERSDTLLDTIFRETTSIGVRIQNIGRKKLSREIKEISTLYGMVRFKISRRGEEVITATPEYEDCKRIAHETGLPLKLVLDEVKKSFS